MQNKGKETHTAAVFIIALAYTGNNMHLLLDFI